MALSPTIENVVVEAEGDRMSVARGVERVVRLEIGVETRGEKSPERICFWHMKPER